MDDLKRARCLYRSLALTGTVPMAAAIALYIPYHFPQWILVASFVWCAGLCAAAAYHLGRYAERTGKCPQI